MQVWLEPIEMVGASVPIPAVLTRIQLACCDAGFQSQKLNQILNEACMVMPGNLEQAKGNYDPSVYAMEVIQTERIRVGFFDRLRDALDEVAQAAGDTIDWCLLFMDYDIHFARHDAFVNGLKCFPYLECYLVVADADSPLMNNWRNPRKLSVQVITEATLQTMAPSMGFQNPIGIQGIFAQQPLPAPAASGNMPAVSPSGWLNDYEDPEEVEEVVKPQPKPKTKYRSIDDP
jgi:hypothetical protein